MARRAGGCSSAARRPAARSTRDRGRSTTCSRSAGGWRIVLDGDLSASYERGTVDRPRQRRARRRTARRCSSCSAPAARARRSSASRSRTTPLTYLQSTRRSVGAAAGARGARQRRRAGTRCRRCTGPRPRDRAYALRTDEAGAAYVQFGDGERGARLPSGSNNVRATYRKGIGAAGNVQGGRARAAARPAARRQGRRATRRRRAAASIPSRRSRRAPRSRSACARSAARSRCSTTRTSRARSAAWRRRTPRCCRCAAGRTVVVSVAFAGGDRLDDLADVAADPRRPARRGASCSPGRRRRSGSR